MNLELENGIEVMDLKDQAYALIYQQISESEKFILDLDGFISHCKSDRYALTSYQTQELIGQAFSIFFTEEDLKNNLPQKYLALALLSGETRFQGKILTKSGRFFCASVRLKTYKDNEGIIRGYYLSIKDITYKLVYEDLAGRIRSRYRYIFENQIFETQIVGIFRINLFDFSLLRANRKALEICGIEKKEDFSLNHFFWDENERKKISRLIHNQFFLDKYHFQARKADNTPIWASITCLFKKEEGYLEGIIADVTESETRLQALEKANFELDTFIYHASHDLRSPLLSILGLLNILQEEDSPILRKKYLDAIENRVNHLDKLVQDLLAISRNERTAIEMEKFDFRTEIKQILRDYYFLDEYRNIDVFLDVDSEIDFYTDPFRLRIILNNLISNAFKYRNSYLKESFVKIDIQINSQKAVLKIIDNGMGIESKYLTKIFDMFFRATDQSKGSGLGLYIVKTMIEKLKGKIQVTSQLGLGTTFTIELPNANH
jgi:PAS domain S-box-containing protein